jgi:carbonic anhydrase/acetyltransferase-like protein (isoleucine patch superfamily)
MPIYALGDWEPDIHADAYVHPDAVVIGQVIIGASSSVWPTAVLRGDSGPIYIGARTSIQDGTVVHTTPSHPTTVGDDVVVGHLVHLEGCVIGNETLIGSGATVLAQAVIGARSLIGAGAVVAPGTNIPDESRAMGVPARIVPGGSWDSTERAVNAYVHKIPRYRDELRRIG